MRLTERRPKPWCDYLDTNVKDARFQLVRLGMNWMGSWAATMAIAFDDFDRFSEGARLAKPILNAVA